MSAGGSNPRAQLKLQTNDMECILCTLEKGIVHQQILDYVLQDGDSLKFTVEGNSDVYITGYTYRHPVRGDGLRERGLTSALVRTAPNGLHSDLSPVSSIDSESRQPRIIEGTVASVKSEPISINMEVGQDGTGDQAEPHVEEYLTVTDEDLTEPEEGSSQERPDSEPADASGFQEDTEEETDHQHNREIDTVSESMTEGAVDDQETDTSVLADTSGMIMEIGKRSDVEPHSQLMLSNETVNNEGNVDMRGDSEDLDHLPQLRGEQMSEETDQIIRKANISYELSSFENGQETAACQSSYDEVAYNITSKDTVEEGLETMQSISNKDMGVSSVVGEKVTESGDTETAVGSSQNQGENQDLVSCMTDLKMRKVTVVLHRIDGSMLCSSDGWLDDCNGHQDGINDGLCQVETGAHKGDIERNISEKYISTHPSDIEMANLLLEMRSGEWTIPSKESSSDTSMGAIDWDEDRIDCSEKESQRLNESPDISHEVERPFEMGRQRSDVQSTSSCQKINEAIVCVTVSPEKGPGSAFMQSETADGHISQHANEKKLQKQLNMKEDLNSTLAGRQLRSATTPTKKNMGTSLQDSAGNQGKSDPVSTPRSFKNKRVLSPRKNITQSEVNNSKVGNSKRKVFANDRKVVGKKLNNSNTNDEKPFHCEYCEKKFVFQSYLLRHERSHTGEKPFNCKFCDKKFAMKSNVVAHERIHTGKYPFKCKFCERKFSCKSKMKYHENIHTGEKLFECKYCGKKFTMRCFLVCHERIHTGEKPFPCKYCEKRFVQKSQMIKHERTHTGERPFSCRYCTKKFSVKSVLKYHERTHTGEKTFRCKYCDKMFTWRKNWLDHTKIHTGDRPFSCKFCGKKFFQKIILLQHEDTHTGERRFKCKYCKRGFSWKNNLMRHLRTHSGGKNDT